MNFCQKSLLHLGVVLVVTGCGGGGGESVDRTHAVAAFSVPESAIATAIPIKLENDAVVEIFATSHTGENLNLGDLTSIDVCTVEKCYAGIELLRPIKTPWLISAQASKITEINMPKGVITKIGLSVLETQGVVRTEFVLAEAIDLEGIAPKAVALVSLKSSDSRPKGLDIDDATSNYFADGSEFIFFNPAIGVKVSNSLGIDIEIPQGALLKPRVFNLSVFDNGADFAMVDIWPYVELKLPINLTFSKIKRSVVVRSTSKPLQVGVAAENRPEAVSLSLSQTASVQDATLQNLKVSTKSISSTGIEKAASADSCAYVLGSPANQAIIERDIKTSGFLNLTWCENLAPYVHIGVVQFSDNRVASDVVFGSAPDPQYTNVLKLFRLDSFRNFVFFVNGFNWDGDFGLAIRGSNQTGRAKGYVRGTDLIHVGRITSGGNSVNGSSAEMCALDYYSNPSTNVFRNCPPLISDGNKRIMEWSSVLTAPPTWRSTSSIQPLYFYDATSTYYLGFVLSSSTSIVNEGVCSTDEFESRWSAVGTTPNGRLIYLSSTSTGTTNAVEMCKVFKALGATNAIRLDGGPSASMLIDNVLKNPLTGNNRLKYGYARYVAYGVGSYQFATSKPAILPAAPPSGK
jgi:Phosphodiester glycosidase